MQMSSCDESRWNRGVVVTLSVCICSPVRRVRSGGSLGGDLACAEGVGEGVKPRPASARLAAASTLVASSRRWRRSATTRITFDQITSRLNLQCADEILFHIRPRPRPVKPLRAPSPDTETATISRAGATLLPLSLTARPAFRPQLHLHILHASPIMSWKLTKSMPLPLVLPSASC